MLMFVKGTKQEVLDAFYFVINDAKKQKLFFKLLLLFLLLHITDYKKEENTGANTGFNKTRTN